jgi:enterochelin esterase-like enzyme
MSLGSSLRLTSRSVVLLLASLWTINAAVSQQAVATKEPSPSDQYVLGPDSQAKTDVPEGKIQEFTLADSKVFPGFEHRWSLYTPVQYDGKKPIALMVFQDGDWYVKRDGAWRVPVVLDNLIARKELPVMVAVFVNPGTSIGKNADGSPIDSNRSVEYDTLSLAYATFLLSEILPEVRKYVNVSDSPEGRGIGGCSSGGIAAFTVAWQRPDQFRKVLSFSGSFTNIRGGQVYPSLVRQAEKKPIRVFQQSGSHDMEVQGWGIWSEANKAMAAALDEKGYDHQFVFGEDVHCGKQGGAIFPDAMRWIWRDYPR